MRWNTCRMKHNDSSGVGNGMWFGSTLLLARTLIQTLHACSFLHLVDTNFSADHELHKIFNGNTVKVSYSYMNNVRSIITNHNTRIIRKSRPQVISADNYNYKTNKSKKAWPLQNKCMSEDIVYKATISTSNINDTKHYIGMTSSAFKERDRNHIKSS